MDFFDAFKAFLYPDLSKHVDSPTLPARLNNSATLMPFFMGGMAANAYLTQPSGVYLPLIVGALYLMKEAGHEVTQEGHTLGHYINPVSTVEERQALSNAVRWQQRVSLVMGTTLAFLTHHFLAYGGGDDFFVKALAALTFEGIPYAALKGRISDKVEAVRGGSTLKLTTPSKLAS
jgi:hypothetical protein